MKKKKKQVSLSKILMVCLVILIPVVIGLAALHKLPYLQNNAPQGGVYSQKDTSLVAYNQQDVEKLHVLEQNREPLSPTDNAIKGKLSREENPLSATADYTITYDPPSDMFQAQITTISIDTAKKEADQWFFNQGMSVEAPCELPLSFTLEDSVAQSLKGLDVIFSPIAPGC
jgi:hypothetical protein